MKEIKLYKSPIKSLRLLFMSSLFVFPSIWFIMNEDKTKIIFWLCLLFFGIGFLISLYNILDRRPQIVITKFALWDRASGQGTIKWESIEEANEVQVYKQVFVALKTNESFVMKRRIYNWAKNLNKMVGAQDVNLNVSYTKVDVEKFITFINIMKNENVENREQVMEIYKHRIK